MTQSEIIDLKYDEIIHETDKAYLLKFDDEQKWVPISVAEIDRDERVVTVPTWWAEQEEFN